LQKPYKPDSCDENNSYIGYYEIDDIIAFFTKLLLKEQGRIIKVKKGIRLFHEPDYTNRRDNGKLLGLFISESDVDSIEVTMKISLGAINEIVQTFRRYNYEIISEHQETIISAV
jgi:hypothetical protein